MGRSKKYDRYKDSGVEWIEEYPEHWESKRLKDFSYVSRGTVDKAVSENEIPVYLVQYTNVYKKMKQRELDNDYLPITVSESELKNSKVLKGDILLTASSETVNDIGRSSVIYEELSNHVFGADVLRVRIPEHVFTLHYKKYLMENHIYLNKFNSLSRGVTRFRFGMNDFKIIQYLIPPMHEQQAIAAFLDHKTSEIDALITGKEKLIELLKEQRQTIITEAVTKGLNPDVKMKDSGVEWIGEVPEHWESKRLKDFSYISRGTVDKAVSENEIPVYLVQYTNVYKKMKQRELDNDYLPITVSESELKNSKVLKGDILLTASSETVNDIGRSSVIYEELSNHVFGADVLRVRIPEHVFTLHYKKYLMENHIYLNKFNSLSRGVTRFRFGMNDFKIIQYLIPPMHEQYAIAAFLDHKTSEIDALITKERTQIEKLKSYRQSLIYEAVTGKIDVRDWSDKPHERSDAVANA